MKQAPEVMCKKINVLGLVFQNKYLNILKSRHIYWRSEMTEVSLCFKREQISACGVRKMILIQRENKMIFLTPLADILLVNHKLTSF